MLAKRLSIEQLEIAKNQIEKGSSTSLRIALILLDNFSELTMRRRIEDHTQFNTYFRRRLEKLSEKKQLSPNLRTLKKELLTEKQIIKIERYYKEKVDYLSSNKKDISPEVAKLLLAAHNYRNEAYHKGQIKEDFLEPAVKLLFQICCDLFHKLETTSVIWSSDYDEEDWQAFFAQYGIKFKNNSFQFKVGKPEWHKITTQLISGIDVPISELRKKLAKHMQNRFETTKDLVDFLHENIPNEIQFTSALRKLKRWNKKIVVMKKQTNKITLFNQFVEIENSYSPFEKVVEHDAEELDRFIQAAIDLKRGK